MEASCNQQTRSTKISAADSYLERPGMQVVTNINEQRLTTAGLLLTMLSMGWMCIGCLSDVLLMDRPAKENAVSECSRDTQVQKRDNTVQRAKQIKEHRAADTCLEKCDCEKRGATNGIEAKAATGNGWTVVDKAVQRLPY